MNALGPEAAALLADYVAFATGSALYDARNFADAEKQFRAVVEARPASPMRARAAQMIARCLTDGGNSAGAVDFIAANQTLIAEPQASALIARAKQAQNDTQAAAAAWQRVYYGWPGSPESSDAEAALAAMAPLPPVAPKLVLERARRLIERGDAVRARRDLEPASEQFAGPDRDLARVRLCEVEYAARNNAGALACLRRLSVASPAADAERLYYLVLSARRLDRGAVLAQYARALAKYRQSSWRLKALVAAGNYFQLRNETVSANRFYTPCAAFPDSEDGPYCLWKLAWNARMRRRADARALLRRYVSRYPDAAKAPAALYFVGGYDELSRRFANTYYGLLAARKRPVGAAAERARTPLDWTPNEAVAARIERARLLAKAGLDDWASGELRFAARSDPRAQPNVLAYELGQLADARGTPERAIRAIKGLFPEYLRLPFAAAPQRFWQLAFPLYYRDAIQDESERSELDPLFVASVIRQESEFDRTVVSNAGAYGLMQLMPATAAELARRASIAGFNKSMLFDPAVNVRLGNLYLRGLLAAFEGRREPALAAYNGGRSRVRDWLTWYTYREPAEFIETIPITETREYVLTIMRDYELYRRIYGK